MLENQNKRTVLIVDDEVEICDLLSIMIQKLGFATLTAYNGREALEIIKNNTIDTIISDLKMPFMDGFQLLYEVRLQGLQIPFILLTAYGDKNATILALRLGAADFFEKPFEPEIFLERVEKIVNYGFALRNIDEEVNELCSKNPMSAEKFEEFRKAKKSILLLRKQRANN